MKTVTIKNLEEESYLLYIHTPFCGTCGMAKKILSQIESAHDKNIFYEMNASLHPEFMQENMVESVPCLLIKHKGMIKEKVYTFHSVPNIYTYIIKYQPDMVTQSN